jgi:hypothetical protein
MSALRLQFNCLGFELYDGPRFLALYRATEELARTEAPKPCFAPIYTPSGGLITEYRPADHLWHTGLYFGWVHVNNANLWGGPWYLPETGKYEYVENSHGVQRHDAFSNARSTIGEATVVEELTWLDPADQPLIRETRRFTFRPLPDSAGYLWLIDTHLTPAGDEVTLGASKAARYSGLVLRMGPPFAEAVHRSSEGQEGHEAVMGQRARWVSAAGAAGGLVVMMDHPGNPRHPTPWFTRRNLLGAAFLMEGTLALRPPESLRLRYGLAMLDAALAPTDVEALYSGYVETSG